MAYISADSHVVEGPDVFLGLAEKYGDAAPRVISKEGGSDFIVIPSRKDAGVNVGAMSLAAARVNRDKPVERRPGHKPNAGSRTDPEIHAYLTGGYAALSPGLTDGALRGADQDLDGVSAEILYPGYFPMFKLAQLDLLIDCQKNYNDWLKDFCDNSNGRLYGLAALPVQSPEAALAELKRVIQLGYKGVIIPSNAPKGTHYYEAQYDPIWALAEEAGIPISMHVGCFSHTPKWVAEAVQRDPIAIYANSQSLIHETLIDLMIRGVCKRFPNLKFVISEFNAGWIAHWLDRVDQAWQRESGINPDAIPYEEVIFDIWRRQFYATIEDDQPAIATQKIIGNKNLMWGSDYPHTDSTFPCSADVLDEMFADHSAEARARITHDNVKALYNL